MKFKKIIATLSISLLLGLLSTSFHSGYIKASAESDFIKIENPGATYKTQRVWLNNDNANFYEGDHVNGVKYTYQDKTYVIEMPAITNPYDGFKYFYADIPFELNTVSFIRLKGEDISQVNTVNIQYGCCYYRDIDSNVSTTYVNGANAEMLASVVESYLTYGKDDSNGCVENTVINLFNTWFRNKSATSEDLKNQKYLDYTGYDASTGSYEGASKTASYSVNEKWNTMCSQVGIDPKTGEKRGIDFSWLTSKEFIGIMIVVATALVSAGAVLVIIIIRKKRQQ